MHSHAYTLNAKDLTKWSSTLSRITALDNALPKEDRVRRDDIRSKLSTIWKVSHKIGKPSRYTIPRLEELDSNISKVYSPLLSDERLDLGKWIPSFSKDLFSVEKPPVISSHAGINGPTLITGYVRSRPGTANHWIQRDIIKWTTTVEAASTDVIRYFSHGFHVPMYSLLDFSKEIHIRTNKETLAKEDSIKLQKNFTAIRSVVCPEKICVDDKIMLSERILGANLFDFAKMTESGKSGGWATLTTKQKDDLLKDIGGLAFLDLFFGNTDRIIRFSQGFDLPKCALSSNLGNLMIVLPENDESEAFLYAIDNGIDKNLLKNPNSMDSYGVFFSDLLQQSDRSVKIAEHIVKSISRSVHFGGDPSEGEESTWNIYKNFYEDLTDPRALHALIIGIEEMESNIRDKAASPEFKEDMDSIQEKYNFNNEIASFVKEDANRVFYFLKKQAKLLNPTEGLT